MSLFVDFYRVSQVVAMLCAFVQTKPFYRDLFVFFIALSRGDVGTCMNIIDIPYRPLPSDKTIPQNPVPTNY